MQIHGHLDRNKRLTNEKDMAIQSWMGQNDTNKILLYTWKCMEVLEPTYEQTVHVKLQTLPTPITRMDDLQNEENPL